MHWAHLLLDFLEQRLLRRRCCDFGGALAWIDPARMRHIACSARADVFIKNKTMHIHTHALAIRSVRPVRLEQTYPSPLPPPAPLVIHLQYYQSSSLAPARKYCFVARSSLHAPPRQQPPEPPPPARLRARERASIVYSLTWPSFHVITIYHQART